MTRAAMIVDGAMPIEGVKAPIACRFLQAIASGSAIVERRRCLGIGTMTALLEKTADLAHRRAIELEEAHRTAAGASEATSRFLAAMSHALRTPLNTIIGFAELMLMRDVEQMTADQRGYITDIRNSGAHLPALVNDILGCSRLEADHLPLSETVFDLRQVLHDGPRLVRAHDASGRRRTVRIADTSPASRPMARAGVPAFSPGRQRVQPLVQRPRPRPAAQPQIGTMGPGRHSGSEPAAVPLRCARLRAGSAESA